MEKPATISENGLVTGYASVFGEADRNGDIVMPGAFQKTLRERQLKDVKFLYQHDVSDPIGVWMDIYEDDRGLRVIGKLLSGVERARECFALIQAGALDGLSIGFRTQKARSLARGKMRELVTLDLWEISLVTFPMLAGARLVALDGMQAPQRLLRSLQQATKLLSATF